MRSAAAEGTEAEFTPDTLPKDPEMLQGMIVTLWSEVARLKDRNERLEHFLALLKRYQFGRRSEKLSAEQFLFPFMGPAEPEASSPPPAVPDPPPATTSKPSSHGRRKIPSHLPRLVEVHDVPAEKRICSGCGGELGSMGQEVSEELEYKPASFHVVQHIRMKYACKQCQENVVIASGPDRPIDKGLPGPGMLSHVLVSKYADHLPLYRQEGIMGRNGIEISRSTLCDWVRECADLLQPLVDAMKEDALRGEKVNTDDTPVPVLDETRKETRTGRLWVYVGDEAHPHVVYDYSPTREKKWPLSFLGGYRGYLQADAYAGYDAAFSTGTVIEVACWAHARRKFFDAQETDRERSLAALSFVHQMYEVERVAKEMTRDSRARLRQERSRPILEAFKGWLQAQALQVLPKSPLGEAIHYALAQWVALNRYLDDGILEIDNNSAERALRPVAIGRKNWMFAGSDEGGRRAAVIYTLIQSCKRSGVEPFAYLRDVIARIGSHPAKKVLDLAPANWKPLQTDSS